MGDKVEVQKRLNDERDKQQKRVVEIEARTQAMMKSADCRTENINKR
ncbi:MAG: hypothetical protein ACL7BU_12155 [Candidatus Phlomobacter fragariae]